ncbi:MAG: hypothetical protein WC917_03555 [Bacilli bacterium]|jgi:hypothetical protein
MNTINFKTNERKTVFSELSGYCPFAKEGKGDFIEVTEWSNGEGFDIAIHDVSGYRTIGFTTGEYSLLRKLVKYLYIDRL